MWDTLCDRDNLSVAADTHKASTAAAKANVGTLLRDCGRIREAKDMLHVRAPLSSLSDCDRHRVAPSPGLADCD